MREEDVPQEGNKTHEGKRKALYAQNSKGSYKITPSLGWKTEEIATFIALNDLKEFEVKAYEDCMSGKVSPILFYMYKRRMDISTLACFVGKFKWQVKRHFKPKIFAKLNEKTLQKYAEAFDISVEKLLKIQKGDY